MPGCIEGAGEKARKQASIGCKHLVRADHRKTVSQGHRDPGLYAGQGLREDDVFRHVNQASPVRAVVPMQAKQIAGVQPIGIGIGDFRGFRGKMNRGIGEFQNPGQNHAGTSQLFDVPIIRGTIDDFLFQSGKHSCSFP